MSELKKLFRVQRILAMVLAVTLAMTSVPVTALAAEPDDIDIQQTAQDTDTEDASVKDDAQDADTEDGSVKNNVQEDETEESQDPDVMTGDDAGDGTQEANSAPADDTQETDQTSDAEPRAEETQSAIGEPFFTIHENWINKEASYNQGEPLFVEGGKLDFLNLAYVDLDGAEHYLDRTDDEIIQTVTYQWFVKDGDKLGEAKLLSEEGVFPTEVGSYTLEFKLPAKENVYKEASARIDFEVTKAVVDVSYGIELPVTPGTMVKDIPDGTVCLYEAAGSDGKEFMFGYVDDPDTPDVNEADANEVAFTFLIKDALTGTVLGDSDVVLADNDYVISLVPAFVGANKDKYNKNYEFAKAEEKRLETGEFKPTKLSLELDAKYDAAPFKTTKNVELITDNSKVVQIIEASSLTDALVNGAPLYKNVKVEAEDGEDDKGQTKWTAVTTAAEEITGTWYTAAEYKEPWTEATKTFCRLTIGGKLDAAPTIPGVYVYRVSYEGDQKQYAGSYADIVVSVAKAQIAVKPTVASGVTFYDKQPVKDVLAKITYELPYVDGTTGNYTITDNMWGTSYIGTDKTQPYKPDFVLVEMTKDADGNLAETQRSPLTSSNSGAALNSKNKYYVQFNGYKSVYTASGLPTGTKGINVRVDSMDPDTCGFEVKTGEDVYKEYQLELTVSEVNQKIVVDDIISAGKSAGMVSENAGDLTDALVKTYDGSRIFVNYADYKKAKLESGQSDRNTSFGYSWERSDYSYDDLLKTKKDETGKDVPVVTKSELESSFEAAGVSISPVNAGIYRLRVTLKDVDGKNYAETAYVYFVIKRQEISVKFNLQSLEGNAGNRQSEFLENHAKELGDATSVSLADGMEGKPSKAEEWTNADSSSAGSIYSYSVSWQIEEKLKEADGTTDKKDESGNVITNPLDYYSTLTGDKDKYVLTVSGIQTYSNNNPNDNYKAVYDDVMIPINVEAMGEAEIKFEGITTVDGSTIELTKEYDGKSVLDSIKDKLAVLNAPITVKEDGKTKDKDVTFAEGEYGLTYTVVYHEGDYGYKTKEYDKLPTEEADWEWTKNAGEYRITVKFGGNKNYARLYETELAVITVEKKELVLTAPVLSEKFKVGDTAADVTQAARKAFFGMTGEIVKAKDGSELPEEIKKYFTKTEVPNEIPDEGMGYLAWPYDGYAPTFYVYDTESEYNYDDDEVLSSTGNTRYMLVCDPDNLSVDVRDNYQITVEPEQTPIEVARGRAEVSVYPYQGETALDISDPEKETSAEDPTVEHEVAILDGIPYYNGTPEGNIVRIQIQAPADENIESSSSATYEQSIKKAAGKRLLGDIDYNNNSQTIWFDYDVTDTDTDLSFTVHWAEDYNENFTFLFSRAAKLGNLKDAVAPKSLAFNGVSTSMVVGQEQELDVKITKVQTGDIICLGYEVTSGKEYMHVNEYGKVTALKAGGKATVMVYPMHVADGKKQRIEGAKTASVSITVKAVTTPKISKVIPSDKGVTVQYALPKETDGYRREIYIVDGKNVKPADIEKKVTSMQNEQWKGIFAVAPKFMSYSDERTFRPWDYKKNAYIDTVSVYIGGLNPTKDYTVYVRNVSAMRTFEDGCAVTLSAAGAAKGFATTKTQSIKLSATLNDKDIHQINWDDIDELEEAPSVDMIHNADQIGYEIPLTAGSVQFSLEGLFNDEAGDAHYEKIPFNNANAKQNFTAPKIAYYFYEYIYDGYDARTGRHVYEDYGFTMTSTLAAVSKSGKVTLKQPGKVVIYAVDTVSNAESQEIEISITAAADNMKAKNTTMSVGQSIRLERLVDYKQGNKVLDQKCYNTYNRIDVKAAQTSLGNNTSFGISNDGYLTAYSKGNISLTLTDAKLGNVTVKVKANDLAPVKNLKAANVIDNCFDVQFEANMYAEGYRIEISDTTRLVRSIYVENLPFSNDERIFESADWYKDERYANWRPAVDGDDDWGYDYDSESGWNDDYIHNNQHWIRYDYSGQNNNYVRCDLVNGKWVFSYHIWNLTQTTKYTMKVTALYKDAQSKAVSKAVTTTKLPAYDYALSGKIEAGKYYAGGMEVTASKNGVSGIRVEDYSFVSGNTYNLIASGANQKARVAGTDTLTWTSSDKKVATVQATAGGYSATLKALKAGTTVIEVKSKVLKGVVARYTINVFTVGDAYKGRDYWGDNQNLREDNDEKQDLVTELSVGIPVAVELSAGQSQTFRFTTTEEGKYEILRISTSGVEIRIREVSCDGDGEETSADVTVKGAFTGSIIVRRTGTNDTTGFANREEIKLGQTVANVEYDNYYVFTAPEEGLYGISSRSYSGAPLSVSKDGFYVYRQDMEAEGGWVPNDSKPETQAFFYELKKGELVYLKAERSASEMVIAKADFAELKDGDSVSIASQSEKWFTFVPTEIDQYEFAGLPYSGMKVYNSDFSLASYDARRWDEDTQTYTYTYSLDQKVYVQVTNSSNTINMSVKKKGSYQKFGEDGTYTINYEFTRYDDYLYITYIVPDDGFYTFSSEAVDGNFSGRGYGALYIDGSQKGYEWSISSGSNYKTQEYYLATGQSVRIRIRSSYYPETWENVNIKAERTGDAPAEITVDSQVLSGTIPADQSKWYFFTASDEAEYVVTFPKLENGSGFMYAYLYKAVTDNKYEKYKFVDLVNGVFMDAISVGTGETRYLKITNGYSVDTEFQVKIQKVPEEMSVTTETPADLTLGTNWVSFTSDADAYYSFNIIEEASNTNNYIEAYEEKGATSSIASNYNGLNMVLNQGQKIWLKVTASSPAASDKTADKLTAGKLGEVNSVTGTSEAKNLPVIEVTESGVASHYAIVKFTANEDKQYTFKGTDTNIKSLYVYKDCKLSMLQASSSNVETGDDGVKSCTTSCPMSTGDVVYLRINLSAASTDLSLTVSTDTEETTP